MVINKLLPWAWSLVTVTALALLAACGSRLGRAGDAQAGPADAPLTQTQPEAPMLTPTLDPEQTWATYCASCHGEQMEAFADRRWRHGKSPGQLRHSIAVGYPDAGMPAFGAALSAAQLDALVAYIETGIERVEQYGFTRERLEQREFSAAGATFRLDTVASGLGIPYSLAFLPEGGMLVTDREGELWRLDVAAHAEAGAAYAKTRVAGVPNVYARSQGGLHHVLLHPAFAQNQLLYLSYSAVSPDDRSLTTTKVSRYRLENNRLVDEQTILEAKPYTSRGHHFGSAMTFDRDGYLYITVGDRGEERVNPQSTSRYGGKVHRLHEDGRIPSDNPFVNTDTALASVWSYGHRNPQGIAIHPESGEVWTHEHGPRGGDELNILRRGRNYGWPIISYGINYDGTTFTNLLAKPGMEQPLHYWVPSIAPSGLAFVSTDRYGAGWRGAALLGSLRFRYLDLVLLDGERVTAEHALMKNIGRLRYVCEGPDGYLYVTVEEGGFVLRLLPVAD